MSAFLPNILLVIFVLTSISNEEKLTTISCPQQQQAGLCAGICEHCCYEPFEIHRISSESITQYLVQAVTTKRKQTTLLDGCRGNASRLGDQLKLLFGVLHGAMIDHSIHSLSIENSDLSTSPLWEHALCPSAAVHPYTRLYFLNVVFGYFNKSASECRGLGTVQKLDVFNSQMDFNRVKIFNDFPNLTQLIISRSNLTVAGDPTFPVLGTFRNLRSLEISFSNLTYVWKLRPGGTVRSVNFNGNRIGKLSREDFSSFPNVETVKLAANGLLAHDIDSLVFANCHMITHMDLSDNNLNMIPDALNGLSKLKVLLLSNNRLESLITSSLSSVSTELEVVDLSFNNLTHLDWDVFQSLPNLVAVDFSANALTNVDSWVHATLSLQLINLRNNAITSLTNHMRVVNSSVGIDDPIIDLSYNRLTDLNFTTLKTWGVAPLERHGLFFNTAFQYHKYDFYLGYHGPYMNLAGNPFRCDNCGLRPLWHELQFDNGFHPRYRRLVKCSDDNNNLRPLVDFTKNEMNRVCELSACHSGCTCVNGHRLGTHYSPVRVQCPAKAALDQMPQEAPYLNDPDLKSPRLDLLLSRNLITILPTRNYYQFVRILDLSHNALALIKPGALKKMAPKLESLDLSFNRLTSLPHELATLQFPSLKNISLSGNPFICDCKLFWIKNWLMHLELSGVRILEKWDLVCKGPTTDQRGQILTELADGYFICSNESVGGVERKALIIVVVSVILLTLAVALAIVAYRNRHRWTGFRVPFHRAGSGGGSWKVYHKHRPKDEDMQAVIES